MKQTPDPESDLPKRPAAPTVSLREVIVNAVYQDGVFRLSEPLDLPPGTPIQLRIPRSLPTAGPNGHSATPTSGVNRVSEATAGNQSPTARSMSPLLLVAIGVAVVAVVGFLLLRHRGESISNAPEETAVRALANPPAKASGAQLPAPEMVAEFKIPATPENQPGGARDIAIDSQGNMYVASSLEGVIRKYDASGKLLLTWGNTAGAAEPIFQDLFAIEIGSDNTVYALDTVRAAVLRFNSEGKSLGDVASVVGYAPHGMSIAPNGDILLAVTGSNNIVRISPNGETVATIGKGGKGPGEFDEPTDMVAKENGEMIVFDARNSRVQHLAENNTLISQWVTEQVAARDSGHFATDKQGRLYVTGPVNRTVQVFNEKDELVAEWPQGEFGGPTAAEIDSQNHLYLVYPATNMVRKFRLP